MRTLTMLIRRFRSDDHGSTAIVFALCVILTCGAIGGAIDMSLHMRARTTHTEAIDAAALAAARVKQAGGSDAEAIARANAFYDEATKKVPVNGRPTFTVSADGRAIEGSGNLTTAAIFWRVIGIDQMHFAAQNRAEFAPPTAVELSLMLDTTGSMSGTKIADLKVAVEQLIDIVIRSDGSGESRIALAPFSSAVALKTEQYREATGESTGGGGCVVERASETFTDAAPGAGLYLETVATSQCKAGQEVFPLTNRKSDLKTMVRSLSTGGMTAGHLGTAWAWYLLSPNWSALFDSAAMPAPYSKLSERGPTGERKLRKIAVLMTDGEYNTSHNGINSSDQARAICAEMRKTGIEVYTVGFDVDNASTVADTLRQCASTPSSFYLAQDGNSLSAAFIDIAKKASNLRLTK